MATYLAPLSLRESCEWWCYKVRIRTSSLAVILTSYRKFRYSLFISEGNYASLSFECIKFLEAEVASIWLLKHIIEISKDYHIPLDLIRLGKTLCGLPINLIHWPCSHWCRTPCKHFDATTKRFRRWTAFLLLNMFTNWLHFSSGATEVFFYQGVMPKVPEAINDQTWGYWSLNDDFLAPAPTFEELECTENFETPYFRWVIWVFTRWWVASWIQFVQDKSYIRNYQPVCDRSGIPAEGYPVTGGYRLDQGFQVKHRQL